MSSGWGEGLEEEVPGCLCAPLMECLLCPPGGTQHTLDGLRRGQHGQGKGPESLGTQYIETWKEARRWGWEQRGETPEVLGGWVGVGCEPHRAQCWAVVLCAGAHVSTGPEESRVQRAERLAAEVPRGVPLAPPRPPESRLVPVLALGARV